MDDLKTRLFDEIWKHFSSDFNSGKAFLDTLYQESILDNSKYQELRNRNGNDLLNSLYSALKQSQNGYEVFIKELQTNYTWIHEKAKALEQDENYRRDIFDNALITGDVPRKPQYYIERTQVLQTIKERLKELRPCGSNKIVLYGMNGIGKSCLASAAVKDIDLLLDCFNNKVFWINVGKVNDEQCFDLMYRLYRKIVLFNSGLADLPKEKPSHIKEMQDNLLMLFRQEPYRKSLIVLDNVCSADVVNYFDAGCNLLIISQERISINQEKVLFLPIQDGFSEEESVRLFAKSLDISYETIRTLDEPAVIHTWCKGDPMLVSLCASLIEERKSRLLKNPKEWSNLIDCLKKMNSDINGKRFEAINMCYESLDHDLQLKYKDFAVFVDDINITMKVLMILWDMEQFEVEQVTQKLQKKCLIVSAYNDDLQTEVFGIHHVFLDFLKHGRVEVDIVNLHKKLIKAYRGYSNYNYSMLPNDNYIFQYVGYHLFEAQMFEEFKIYFDLDFIGAKIRATGIADVLRDFSSYNRFITKEDATLADKLKQFTSFVEEFGQNLHKYKYTDIIQSALQLPRDHMVYVAAYNIARDRCGSHLYFSMHAPHESNYYTHMLNVNDKFKAACFTEETNAILIGTETGAVEVWEPKYAQKLQTFTGHTDAILSLKLNEARDKFLSISRDGTVKLWNLSGMKNYKRNSRGFVYDENGYNQIPSPHVKQDKHQIFFGSDVKVDRSHTFPLNGSSFVSAAFSNDYAENQMIVTGTENGSLIIYSQQEKQTEISLINAPVNCVSFSNDDSLVIASCESDIFFYNARNGEFLLKLSSADKSRINALHTVPFDDISSFITIQDKTITKWTWEQEHVKNNEIAIRNYHHEYLFHKTEVEYKFVCSTITDKYLVAGSTDSRIRMWDIENKAVIEEFTDQNGHVVCLDACVNNSDNSIHILLTGFEDQTVKMWHVQPNQIEKRMVKSLPMLAAYWNANDSRSSQGNHSPLIAIPNTDNKIQILRGHNLVVETESQKVPITSIAFSLCGNNVYYGMGNGSVLLYKIKCKETKKIMSLEGPVTYLEIFNVGSCFDIEELLVAASEMGMFSVCRNGECKMLLGLVENLKIPVAPILKSYLMKSNKNKLLTISKNKMLIKCWDLDSDSNSDVLFGDCGTDNSAMTTCISNDESLICITTNSSLRIFQVNIDEKNMGIKQYQTGGVGNCLTCCCFSHNNKYLALGCDNGNIVIWDLEQKRKYITLEMHTTRIRSLVFSPSHLILISVAEQVAWWNLKKVPDSTRRSFRSRSNSMKQPLKPPSFELPSALSLLNIGEGWSDKTGPKTAPHLLSTIKLHGTYAECVSFSQDFESFLTVDNHGEIYIMDVLNNYEHLRR